MKRKLSFLIGTLLLLSLVSVITIQLFGKNKESKTEKFTIVTSFYPVYILTLNLTKGIDNVEVINLTSNSTGCLHDYQLTTNDMRSLNNADILIINGGDMEPFLENVAKDFSNLKVIDASTGINFLEGSEHSHEEEHDHAGHEENEESDLSVETEKTAETIETAETKELEETTETKELEETEETKELEETEVSEDSEENHIAINGHVWMDMNRYLQQIDNIAKKLEEYNSENTEQYKINAETYATKVLDLKEEYEEILSEFQGTEVIAFHGAFTYMADELGLDLVYMIDMDEETALSAGDVATIVDEINNHQIRFLFAERQYSKEAATNIAKETGAKVYELETLVSGETDIDAYLNGMNQNLTILKSAFQLQ